MTRRMIRMGVATAAAATMAVALTGTAATSTASSLAATPKVHITITNKTVTVDGPSNLTSGPITFRLTAVKQPHAFEIVGYKGSYNYKKMRRDLQIALSHTGANGFDKKGRKAYGRVLRNTILYGGLSAIPGHDTRGALRLPKAGTYLLFDDTELLSPQHPRTLVVAEAEVKRAAPTADGAVTAKDGNKFAGPKTFPHKGTLRFRNGATDGPHVVVLQHVKEGTTRQDVLDYLQSGVTDPAPYLLNGTLLANILSPHRTEWVRYRLPKGDYVAMDLFPDPATGIPHALEGMVRIIHLT